MLLGEGGGDESCTEKKNLKSLLKAILKIFSPQYLSSTFCSGIFDTPKLTNMRWHLYESPLHAFMTGPNICFSYGFYNDLCNCHSPILKENENHLWRKNEMAGWLFWSVTKIGSLIASSLARHVCAQTDRPIGAFFTFFCELDWIRGERIIWY